MGTHHLMVDTYGTRCNAWMALKAEGPPSPQQQRGSNHPKKFHVSAKAGVVQNQIFVACELNCYRVTIKYFPCIAVESTTNLF